MALIQRIKELFKYSNNRPAQSNQINPLVTMLGYEKNYGVPHPEDFKAQVEACKSWAYACGWKNATSVAKTKFCLYKKSYNNNEEEEKLTKIKQHPLMDLLNNVNPHSNKFELFTLTQLFQELTGNSYWWIPRGVLGIPESIWNIPSHWMRIVPSKTRFIEGYIMQTPGSPQIIPFDEEEIIHFKFPSPFNIHYGSGPLHASRFGIDLNEQIKTWGINFFLNNAQPSGVLMTENSLSKDQYERLRDRWNQKYRGSKNAGKVAILESGLKYEQTGSTVKEAQFGEMSREIRDEILAIFGVPASKLGLVEDVNRANAEANDYTYQKETILPRLTLIEEKINEKLSPIYDERLVFQFENTLPEDKEFRLREKQINIQSGFSTIDEEREREGLEAFELPETSAPLIPFSLVPAGSPKPENTYDPSQEESEDKSITKDVIEKKRYSKWRVFVSTTAPHEKQMKGMMERFFQAQHGEVMKSLNNYRSLSGAVTKDLSINILFNHDQSAEKLRGISRSYVRQALVAGINLGITDTNSPIDFNLFEPNILRAVEKRVRFFADSVNKNTAELIRVELEQAFKQGESISDISKRVDKVFNFSQDFRSKRIAQTEVIGATNSGQVMAYHEAGVEQKEWISARDSSVRDSHKIDGQTVTLTQSFKTKDGNHLQYPGDRSSGAPASDLINCRCTVLPVIRTN